MNLQMLKDGEQGTKILMECISGSKAYRTDTPQSDTDKRGLFAWPKSAYLGLNEPPPQVGDEKHDIVFYSLKRFFNLAADVNPNIIELLYVHKDCIISSSPAYKHLSNNAGMFLSKKAYYTFSGYAVAQIKKSEGQGKRVHNPQPKTPPSKVGFCYYIPKHDGDSMPMRPIPVSEADIDLSKCRVAALERASNTYRLYASCRGEKTGVFRGDNEQLVCDSISMGDEKIMFLGLLLYNEQEYEKALKEWQQYWEWMDNRNPERWKDQESGKTTYDAKNIMHCFRLIHSAKSILRGDGVIVRVAEPYRSFLMEVRSGKFEHKYLLDLIDKEMKELEVLFANSKLPHSVDKNKIEKLYREVCDLV